MIMCIFSKLNFYKCYSYNCSSLIIVTVPWYLDTQVPRVLKGAPSPIRPNPTTLHVGDFQGGCVRECAVSPWQPASPLRRLGRIWAETKYALPHRFSSRPRSHRSSTGQTTAGTSGRRPPASRRYGFRYRTSSPAQPSWGSRSRRAQRAAGQLIPSAQAGKAPCVQAW